MYSILFALFMGVAMAEAPAQAGPQDFRATIAGAVTIATSPSESVGDFFLVVSEGEDTITETRISAAFGDSSALSAAEVDPGTLSAQVEASNIGQLSQLYTQAFAIAQFADKIRFVGMPDGTPVDIEISHAPEYSVQSTNVCEAGFEVTRAEMSTGFGMRGLFIGGLGVKGLFLRDSTCDGFDAATAPSAIITVFVGQEYDIESDLNLDVLAESGFSSSVDARTRFYITPLGDFDYITASGNDYRRPDDEEPTVEEQLEDLVQTVASLNLQAGISNSLDAKLDAARNALDDLNEHNDGAAINSLYALINHIEAQRGQKLSDEEADTLIAATLAIIEAIQSGGS